MRRTSKNTALLLALACALALLLTACGGGREQNQSDMSDTSSSSADAGQDSGSAESAGETDVSKTGSFSLPFMPAKASLLDLANDYLSGEAKLANLYEADSDGWIKVNATKEWIKPGAVYPGETWTPDDIIASFVDGSAPWTGDYDTHHLWSSDYEHTFMIDDNIRCYIDDKYVGTAPHRQYSMDPLELLRLYQSGDWDGLELIWSEDDSTFVAVQWRGPNTTDRHRNGCLRYEFENFTEEADVWPWWENDDSYELEPYAMARTMRGEGENAYLKYDEVLVPLYVDLPNGELTDSETFGEVLQIVPCSSEEGVLVYTTKGIWLFKAGNLVLGWPSADAAELAELGYQ